MAMDDVWKKENDMNASCRTRLVLFFFMTVDEQFSLQYFPLTKRQTGYPLGDMELFFDNINGNILLRRVVNELN